MLAVALLGATACTSAPVPNVSPTAGVPSPSPTPPAPTSSPTVPIADLSVASEERFEAGGDRFLRVAPDGEWVALVEDRALCVRRLARLNEGGCADGFDARPDDTSLVWSPDSRRLLFTEDFMRTFDDTDVWALDRESGALADLTDDGVSDVELGEFEGTIDLAPRWLPDGSGIVFARSKGPLETTELWQMSIDGSDPREIARVADTPVSVFLRQVVSRDGARIYFTVFSQRPEEPENGLFVLDRAAAEIRRIAGADGERGIPAPLGLSADEQTILVYYPLALARLPADESAFGLVDIDSGDVRAVAPETAPERRITSVTLSPDGSRLLYSLASGQDPGTLVARAIDAPEEKVLYTAAEDEQPLVAVSRDVSGLLWLDDGSIWLNQLDGALLLRLDGG